MNQGKYVFSQLVKFLPQRVFDRITANYQGNKSVKHFTCWNQLLCMIFGQISARESLRDLITTIEAHQSKSYHLGFGKSITRSNLSKANEKRNYKIFEEFANHLIGIAQLKNSKDTFGIKGNIYAFDSSTVDLCLSVFCWAHFRKTKAGIKLHTLFDINTQIPVFIHITKANIHDVNAMDVIDYEPLAYYIFDRAYVDYQRLYRITKAKAYFVVRAKSNIKFNRMYSNTVDKTTGIKYDQIGKIEGFYTSKDYPEKLRKVKFVDKENGKTLVFLTNNFDLSANDIALLYKQRWQVELFFKWIKQHLKVKTFWGRTENAVRTQINIAIITYCLINIIAKDLKINRSTYEIIQILSASLLDKTPVNELLMKSDYNNVKELNTNQLVFNLF
ncbi:MAG: IS4 family transposase [Algibacter sp.]|uniref:IS4 family transposase n=1 Tax=Algibacter sp. TaxID=1872428 RepID=UPI00260ED09C|nr:IS4 family transposase [Algibacter sp.]MDG1730014.1 IS4 family transposase [Algibacter sp.]MDG2177256.1 IS4 family transposase [Algibacter sp.]